MQRRLFLSFPLVASALVAGASESPASTEPGKGFKVEKGKGRGLEGLKILGGTFDCKVSGQDTNGQLCIFDTLRSNKGGPPLHLHHNQDEWFYVVKGAFIIQVGDEKFTLQEGDSVFGPRKIPHSFSKISEGEAQLLVMFQPAGSMEAFFREREQLEKETDPAKKEAGLKTLWDRHGMQVVGSPIG